MPAEAQTRWLEENVAGAARLAQLVSLASLVDPGLLRAARIALSLPVSAELELRCSPIVSFSGPVGLTLTDEVLPQLRAALQPAALDRAWNLMQARHGALSPALVLEETLTWQALVQGAAAAADAEKWLNQALVTVVRHKKPQLAAWAARCLPRLPESIRQLPSARYLASAVEVSGYKNGPGVLTYGTPPSWMLDQPLQLDVEGSVAWSGSALEVNCPPRPGHSAIRLPTNRRIWISWWRNQERVRIHATVPRNRPLVLEVEGVDVSLDAPGCSRITLRDQTAPRVELAPLLSIPPDSTRELIAYLRENLPRFGVNALPEGATPAFPGPESDFLLVVTAGSSDEADNTRSLLSSETWGCRPLLLLRTLETAQYIKSSVVDMLPPELQHMAAAEIDCFDRDSWNRALEEIVEAVRRGAPALATLTGVPELPPVFLRRDQLFDELRTELMENDDGIVSVFGAPGSGRTFAAADVVRDCSIRRRYHGGILWPHDDQSFPDDLPLPTLVVLADPRASDYGRIRGSAHELATSGSCMLVLTTRPFSRIDRPIASLDGSSWTDEQLMQLFSRAAGDVYSSQLQAALDRSRRLLHSLLPRAIVSLGRLFGIASRSGQTLELDWEELAQNTGFQDALFNLPLVEPFAACPPDWKLASPKSRVWRRYFENADPKRITDAYSMVTKLFPDREIPEAVSVALAELAVPTHRRIVNSYREECGGDWALGPDDEYFLEYFAYHLWHAEPERLAELTHNIDWQTRAAREAPDWLYALPRSVRARFEDQRDSSPSLRAFAEGRVSPLTGKTGSLTDDVADLLGSEIGANSMRMAQARLTLQNHGRVPCILLVGTSSYKLEQPVIGIASAVGRELARWGYRLVTRGTQGVDYLAAQSYTAQLATNDIPADAGLLHLPRSGSRPDFPQGAVQTLLVRHSESDYPTQLVRHADAVIVIGGNGPALDICGAADRAEKPVFPIPGSGGDAQVYYGFMRDSAQQRLASIRGPLRSSAERYQVAQALIKLLPPPPTESGQPPPRSKRSPAKKSLPSKKRGRKK